MRLQALALVLLSTVPLSFADRGTGRAIASRPKFNWNDITRIFAFGDSYTYVDGTDGHSGFSFIGDLLNFSFTPETLLTDQIIENSTSSGGRNWIEFLTGCFAGSPLECEKQLWDFAFAGSDIDGNLLPLHTDYIIPLVDQVNQWVQFASKVVPHPKEKTLTAWWIGINDTGDTLSNATITNFTEFWETEMEAYFNAVQRTFNHGLTQHLFINVPPTDRAPGSVGDAAKAVPLKEHIELFNEVLENHVELFKAKNPGAFVTTFDSNTFFNNLLDNAAEFGFTNITGFCSCYNESGFFWWNSGHPTEQVHQLMANALESHLLNVSASASQ